MMTTRQLSYATGAVATLFGLVAMWQSATLSFFAFGIPGPGFFPFGAALALALAGLSVCLVSRHVEPDPITFTPSVLSMAAVAGYFALFAVLGVFAATLLYTVVVLCLLGRLPIRTALITAGVTLGLLWLVFEYWIGTPFPHGLLW